MLKGKKMLAYRISNLFKVLRRIGSPDERVTGALLFLIYVSIRLVGRQQRRVPTLQIRIDYKWRDALHNLGTPQYCYYTIKVSKSSLPLIHSCLKCCCSAYLVPKNMQKMATAQITNSVKRQLTKDEWETLKPIIKQLYIVENKSFPEVSSVLQNEHRFSPTFVFLQDAS